MSITKIATQGAADVSRLATRAGGDAARLAEGLIAKNTNLGGLNLKEAGLAEDMVQLAKQDPDLAAAVQRELRGQLSGSNYREVSEAMPSAAMRVEDEALAAQGVSKADRAAILDMVQMGFDIAGIFDPTPASDGISGAISLARGDWLGAGISLVSMVPYVGDLAKAGKIGKWAQAVAGGAEMLAKYGADSVLGRKALASLETIGAAIDKIPAAALDALPASAKAKLLDMKATIDAAVARATGRGADDALPPASYDATVRGKPVALDGVESQTVNYVKRDRAEYQDLRKAFDSSGRKNFLKSLAEDPDQVAAMKRAGLTDANIERIASGRVPKGWQVHHKLPLDDGGTNDFSNLVLIKNDPYHIGLTNAQRSLVGDLDVGASRVVDFPVPRGSIYPPSQ